MVPDIPLNTAAISNDVASIRFNENVLLFAVLCIANIPEEILFNPLIIALEDICNNLFTRLYVACAAS